MARARSPNRDKAYQMWLESGQTLFLKDIAAELGVSESQIRKWKNQDKWGSGSKVTLPKSNSNVTKQKGAPKGNKNAVGNSGGSAPPENKNAEKHGLFAKYLPEDSFEIFEAIETRSPIELLWDQIKLQYTAIIRSQQIMDVRSKEEMIKELKKAKQSEFGDEVTYEFQFAWDRQATYLNAQSRAMTTLNGMMKQYEEMVNSPLATAEQKLRIEKLRVEIDKVAPPDGDQYEDDGFIDALKGSVAEVWADEE